jgi:hypothetical protein
MLSSLIRDSFVYITHSSGVPEKALNTKKVARKVRNALDKNSLKIMRIIRCNAQLFITKNIKSLGKRNQLQKLCDQSTPSFCGKNTLTHFMGL